MGISFDAPISGIQAAMFSQDVTANNVANVNTPGFEQSLPYQTDIATGGTRVSNLAKTPNPDKNTSNTDLVEQTKEQKINGAAVQADVAVIRTQDKMMGTLLDMFA